MRVLRSADYRRMPWKNGGGETMEIAVFPAGAALDDFGWRLSMARVASDGPFSLFQGINRSLCILEGAGVALTVGDAPPLRLDRESDPFFFPADAETSAALVDGPITDLNLMTRRSIHTHRLRRQSAEGMVELDGNTATFIVAENAPCTLSSAAGPVTLQPLDCALFEEGKLTLSLTSEPGARIIVGEIEGRRG